jgi:hypothetical protein
MMLFNNESLNCDGHQFHQYQHNEPLILAELSEHKKITTYDYKIDNRQNRDTIKITI